MGVTTHYALDLLLTNLSGGMVLLFPFSWASWTLNIIPDDDLNITLLAIGLSLVICSVSAWIKRRNIFK